MTIILLFSSTVYAQTGRIAVKVTQIDLEKGGKVKIGVYDSNGFPVVGRELYGVYLEVQQALKMLLLM